MNGREKETRIGSQGNSRAQACASLGPIHVTLQSKLLHFFFPEKSVELLSGALLVFIIKKGHMWFS